MIVIDLFILVLHYWLKLFIVACEFELCFPLDQAMASEMPRDFIGMSLPERPNKFYFTLRNHRIVVEADLSIQNIMEKLQSYKSRVTLVFEVSISYVIFFLI